MKAYLGWFADAGMTDETPAERTARTLAETVMKAMIARILLRPDRIQAFRYAR